LRTKTSPLAPSPRVPQPAGTNQSRDRKGAFRSWFSLRFLCDLCVSAVKWTPANSEPRAAKQRGTLAIAVSLLALAGCRQDMHDQPKYIPLRPSDFFADGRSARPIPEGTVSRGNLKEDTLYYTGKGADGKPSNEFPMPVTKELILRGEQRYNIYCTPCHDRTGNGNGMIVRRGYRRPPTYHSDRMREQPNGYYYDVITNGFGAMPDYAAQIQPQDRWAIVAYIRALQLSQQASINDVPAEARGQLTAPAQQPAAHKEGEK